MREFRDLATTAGAREELLREIGKLCSGKHPASKILERARNNLGFHWDPDVIAASVREYGRNQKIIWIETADGPPVFRLAADVLAHALVVESSLETNPERSAQIASEALGHIGDAMNTLIEFSTAVAYGYMRRVGGERHAINTE